MPYPHERDDCAACERYDADMIVTVDDSDDGDRRWCQHCAGALLSRLVLLGNTATVRPLNSERPALTVVPDVSEPTSSQDYSQRALSVAPAVDPGWTIDLAQEALRLAKPHVAVFLRALVDEGGKATAERLRELTDLMELHRSTGSVNAAARKLWRGFDKAVWPGNRPYAVLARRDPKALNDPRTHSYELPETAVPIWDAALKRHEELHNSR